jgi:putative transposase
MRDAYTREGLAVYWAWSTPAAEGLQVFQRLGAARGAPGDGKSDHGPELFAQKVTTWLRAPHIETSCIAPGSPGQHGHHASCNGGLRTGCLHRWLFTSGQEARRLIKHGREESHNVRPHGALEGLTPRALAASCRRQGIEHAA